MPSSIVRTILCLQTIAPGEGDPVVTLHASLDGAMLALQRSTVFLQFIHLRSSKIFVQVCTSAPCSSSSTCPVHSLSWELLQWLYMMPNDTDSYTHLCVNWLGYKPAVLMSYILETLVLTLDSNYAGSKKPLSLAQLLLVPLSSMRLSDGNRAGP